MPSSSIPHASVWNLPQYFKYIRLDVVIFPAYLITAWIGLNIHPVNTFSTFIWPPIGIALAVFFLYGYRVFPAIALAAFAVNLWIGATPLSAVGIAIGNTLGPLAGAFVLRQYVGFNPLALRLRYNVGIITVACIVPIMTASVGVANLWAGGTLDAGNLASTWGTWWIGDTLGILVLAPFIIKWFARPQVKRTQIEYIEFFAALTAVMVTSYLIFWIPQTHFEYYLFIPLAWVALRTGPQGTSLAILLVAIIATIGTVSGLGPFADSGLLYLQIFIGTTAVLYLIFAAVVEENKGAQIALEQHVDSLETALHRISSEDEAKTKFLAVLAHELRNPLAAILSSVELLKVKGVHAEETPALLETVDEHVHVMASLLDDLLDVSRISREKLRLKRETVSLKDIIDRSVRTAQVFMHHHGHTLAVTKPANDMFLDADPVRLEQIIVNLLNNAAKYTDPRGSIGLSAGREGGMAVIRVRDSGIGIQRNHLKRIFEPFFQGERGQVTGEGLGIGLSLTRQLVEMHGGTIEAMSGGENQGSEFIVRLPLPARVQPAHGSPSKLLVRKTLLREQYTLKILVVDDNASATEALGRLLTLRGHEVALAYSGSEAIQKASQFHPQVVILDIGLPDVDGYEVARTLRKQKGFSAVLIALTGYGQESDKKRAQEAGFDKHLTKPVGLKEIDAILRKVVSPKVRRVS